jgi:NAD(P)-dependent dehydrogenase (short-subunit alcohol dehydrogenase family)
MGEGRSRQAGCDPFSIEAFARDLSQSRRPLHTPINSAGIMAPPPTRDARGWKSRCSANRAGHFQLTLGLWPALRQAEAARVVAVVSRGHRRSGVDFDDPNFLV